MITVYLYVSFTHHSFISRHALRPGKPRSPISVLSFSESLFVCSLLCRLFEVSLSRLVRHLSMGSVGYLVLGRAFGCTDLRKMLDLGVKDWEVDAVGR